MGVGEPASQCLPWRPAFPLGSLARILADSTKLAPPIQFQVKGDF